MGAIFRKRKCYTGKINNTGLKLASGNSTSDKYADAYSKAKSLIIIMFTAVDGQYTHSMSISVPKADISSLGKYYYTGGYYNSTENWFAQCALTPTSISSVNMYKNATSKNPTVDFYYD